MEKASICPFENKQRISCQCDGILQNRKTYVTVVIGVKITNYRQHCLPSSLDFLTASCYSAFPFLIVSLYPNCLIDLQWGCSAYINIITIHHHWFSLHMAFGICFVLFCFNCIFHCLTTFSSYSIQAPTFASGYEVSLPGHLGSKNQVKLFSPGILNENHSSKSVFRKVGQSHKE